MEEERMAKYLLIESRDPYESNDAGELHRLAAALARKQHEVTLFLVQNGVLPARLHADASFLDELRAAGVEILADQFSLRERGIVGERLTPHVTAADLDAVIDRLAEGRTTLWH
jgi:sulfur relay (sulfurtransferase) complex TusBCD TusD component (DsrE family)